MTAPSITAATELERRVIGANEGADGDTTLGRAEDSGRPLDLQLSDRVLELGR